ncbi:MAG: hypothetical protein PHP06_04410 [Clostridia bacterium]|nr:hypothetical protein [Clostridia bacterium]
MLKSRKNVSLLIVILIITIISISSFLYITAEKENKMPSGAKLVYGGECSWKCT